MGRGGQGERRSHSRVERRRYVGVDDLQGQLRGRMVERSDMQTPDGQRSGAQSRPIDGGAKFTTAEEAED